MAMFTRKIQWALAAAFGTAVVAVPVAVARPALAPRPMQITVYKDPDCGCCRNWVDHLKKHGFKVTTHDTRDMSSVKSTFSVNSKLHSCHTAVINGYVIEGHVPAADIKRLLRERPKVAGLAVPGMPVGSPGMEGSRSDKYSVMAFDKTGKTKVFANH